MAETKPRNFPESLDPLWDWASARTTYLANNPRYYKWPTDSEHARVPRVLRVLLNTLNANDAALPGSKETYGAADIYHRVWTGQERGTSDYWRSIDSKSRAMVSQAVNQLAEVLKKYFEDNNQADHILQVVFPRDPHPVLVGRSNSGYGLVVRDRLGTVVLPVPPPQQGEESYGFRWKGSAGSVPIRLEWLCIKHSDRPGLDLKRDVKCCLTPRIYQVPEPWSRYREQLVSARLDVMRAAYTGNSDLLRIARPPQAIHSKDYGVSRLNLIGEKTCYLDHVATNYSFHKVIPTDEGSVEFWQLLSPRSNAPGSRYELALNECANPLTINLMLVVADPRCPDRKQLVFNLRNRALDDPGEYGPSVSGLVKLSEQIERDFTHEEQEQLAGEIGRDWSDEVKCLDLYEDLKRSVREELGGTVSDALADVQVLGYGVHQSRGLRALLCVAEVRLTEDQVRISVYNQSNRQETRDVCLVDFDLESVKAFLSGQEPGDGIRRVTFLQPHCALAFYYETCDDSYLVP